MVKGKRGAPAPRPRSGFVTEEQRHTERLTLRLDPEAMDLLRAYSKSLGVSMSTIVERALESFKNDPLTRADMRECGDVGRRNAARKVLGRRVPDERGET